MAGKRVKTDKYPGVYKRETASNPPKMFKGKPDCSYDIVYTDEKGRNRWECVGRRSTGMTAQAANELRMARMIAVWKKRQKRTHGYVPDTVVAIVRQTVPDVRDLFFEQAARYFVWMKKEGKHGDKERNRYEKHIHSLIGQLAVADIDWAIAEHLKHSLLKKMAPASVKKCLSTCSAIFGHYNRTSDAALPNPFSKLSGFKMPKVVNRCERYLQPEEAALLLGALKKRSSQLHDMSYLSLHTGLRSTEIFNLRGSDIDPDGNIFYVTGKGGRRTAVYTGQDVMDILLQYKTTDNKHLFLSRDGKKLKQISDTFVRTAEDIGLSPPTFEMIDGKQVPIRRTPEEKALYQRQKVWFHTLRHTFATWLARSGEFSLYELQNQLRHETIQMTERYAHFIPENVKDPSKRIHDLLGLVTSKFGQE